MYERNQCLTPLKSPASSNPVDLGWYAVRTNIIGCWELRGGLRSLASEATVKACGVAVAISQGHSWAPHLVDRFAVNVGTTVRLPCRRAQPGAAGRVGASSADGHMVGRRGRSSPSGGKPRAWRRAPADWMQLQVGSEALVNTGELSWPDPVGAAMRVRQMQTKLHHWAVS